MAIAGRVAIVPKGAYSETATYKKLDLVTYNEAAYIAKRESTGIEPTDGDDWMLLVSTDLTEIRNEINNIADGSTVVGKAKSDNEGNKISTNYAQKRSWYCGTKVGSWSRICSITGTATGELLNVKFAQNNQSSSYTYMIGTGYNSAYITQISASGFTANSNLQIRLTCDSTNKLLFYVEILNDYGYDGATSVQAQCGIIDLNRYAISFDVTIYTDYTATVEGDTVVAGLTSQPKGIVSDTFYGKDFTASTDVEELVKCQLKNLLHEGGLRISSAGNLGIWSETLSKWLIYATKSGEITMNGNAVSATKAKQDGDGNTITSTYLRQDKVANNLVTNDSSYALGAPQGVTLDNRLTTVENTLVDTSLPKVTKLTGLTTPYVIKMSDGIVTSGKMYLLRTNYSGTKYQALILMDSSGTSLPALVGSAEGFFTFSVAQNPNAKITINSNTSGVTFDLELIEL